MDEAMIIRAVGCLACAAAVVCTPTGVRGEGQSGDDAFAVALEYSAAPGCADENDFKAIVKSRLGYDAFRADARDRVVVQIAARGNSFEGHIERRTAEGRWAGDRTFPSRSDDCGELGRAMAFALALQIQLSAKGNTAPPETAKTSEALVAPIPATPQSTPTSGAQANPTALKKETASGFLAPRPTLAIGAGGLLGFGLSSRTVPFARAFGSMAWQRSSLELAAEAAWPTTTRREDGAGFSQQLLLVGVAGCRDLQPWIACLVAKAGTIRILGKDVDTPNSLWGPILQTGLRLGMLQSLGRYFYVAARAEGLVNVTQWNVTLDQHQVWTAPRFAAVLGLDVGVRVVQARNPNQAVSQNAGGRDD